jgi:hypothetical protein
VLPFPGVNQRENGSEINSVTTAAAKLDGKREGESISSHPQTFADSCCYQRMELRRSSLWMALAHGLQFRKKRGDLTGQQSAGAILIPVAKNSMIPGKEGPIESGKEMTKAGGKASSRTTTTTTHAHLYRLSID